MVVALCVPWPDDMNRAGLVGVIFRLDSTGEHPTQSLLDVFTIFSELGGVAGKTVTMVRRPTPHQPCRPPFPPA